MDKEKSKRSSLLKFRTLPNDHEQFKVPVSLLQVSESSGKLSIKFVKFKNPGSRSQNGECCDNVLSCISSCEIFIRLCLTVQSRSSSCSLIDFETPVLGDDFFDFTNSLGNGISNPVLYSFDHWTVSFL